MAFGESGISLSSETLFYVLYQDSLYLGEAIFYSCGVGRRLDGIFLWICPSSSCGLYFHQRGHPGCFILLFLVTFSQLLFLCLPVEKQNSIWGLGASFIVPSGEVNLRSSGVLSAYSLYPKSTFFFFFCHFAKSFLLSETVRSG